jgi:glyoxylase-like metal-dependent hydrolase (beta-lactamase superfamily II)
MAALEAPIMLGSQRLTESWTVLPSFLPVPGMGALAVNAFLFRGREPMLVDTGLTALSDAFLERLAQEIDLEDLRWVFLSHTDADHIGNLQRVMARAPNARLITTFLGYGKMGMMGWAPEFERVHLLEPGARFDVGGRDFVPIRPPYYDAPETLGFFDAKDRVLFAADSFGALLSEPAMDVDAIPESALRDGLVTWASIDAPWLAHTDRAALGRTLSAIDRLGADILLSGHLPASRGGVTRLTSIVHDAWGAGPSGGIDPLAVENIVAALA